MRCITDTLLFLLNQPATVIPCINDSQIQNSNPKLSLSSSTIYYLHQCDFLDRIM